MRQLSTPCLDPLQSSSALPSSCDRAGDRKSCLDIAQDCCAPFELEEEAKCANGLQPVRSGQPCFGFRNGDYSCCSVPHPPPLPPRSPPPPHPNFGMGANRKLGPFNDFLSVDKCEAMFRIEGGYFQQMWNRAGWRMVRDETPCWEWGRSEQFFDVILRGDNCKSNWYEGDYEGVSDRDFLNRQADVHPILGFDDSIQNYCQAKQNQKWGRRALREGNSSHLRNSSSFARNGSKEAAGQAAGRRPRRLQAGRVCEQSDITLLALFGNNVHNTGAGYNQCRNLEWQMCAAMGQLPGQKSKKMILAHSPLINTRDEWRPMGACRSYSPQGCGPDAYVSDDIFFLEMCTYSLICKNREELFHVHDGGFFECDLDEQGFRLLQYYVTHGKE